MKIKDFFTICKNKKNKQDVLTLKKKTLKSRGISKEDLLNIKIDKILKGYTK